MLPVPELRRAAAQLGEAAVFAVVVAHRAVVDHGRDVGEGALGREGGRTHMFKGARARSLSHTHTRFFHTAAFQQLPHIGPHVSLTPPH